ncbi:serine hydrolase [Sphaerisporangium fuscum]|uniref:serine hydrolase n=1 Tax=Sphaerisporangium fuscum TaxID=2835868 RepID=UPI001BDD4E61|nr:serine hydrolase [Sphaerisporangium fuscum]
MAAALALTACTTPKRSAPTASTSAEVTPAASASGAATAAPDTPVGRQLGWFLGTVTRLPLPESEVTAHMSAGFLAEVPPAKLNELLGQLADLRLDGLTEAKPTALTAMVTAAGQRLTLTMAVDEAGRIEELRLSGADQPSSAPAPADWSEVDTRLRAVAPDVGFLAAELTRDGACRPVHAIEPATPRPLGSIFKLYVLSAVADRIRDGKLSWDTSLTITGKVRIPPGVLYEKPEGSTVTVREAAKLMISISDNAGTDLLIDTVGRPAVEAQVREWSGHATLNIPFLTTREFVLLKAADYPRLADTYTALKGERRRHYLETTVAGRSLAGLKDWSRPRHIGSVEWFGSPGDVCRAYAGLAALGGERLHEVMSASDAGLKLDPGGWPAVWYKGGSEAGVLTMAFLARSATGRTFVVTVLTSDPRTAYDEAKAAAEPLSLVRGSFSLLAKK